MYAKNYFRQSDKDKSVKLPVKWMAPESLTDGLFSEKSDVVRLPSLFKISFSLECMNHFMHTTLMHLINALLWFPLVRLFTGSLSWYMYAYSLQWSFGVTCWEVFSGGKTPYPGVDPMTLSKMLEGGKRLSKPLNSACPEELLVATFLEALLVTKYITCTHSHSHNTISCVPKMCTCSLNLLHGLCTCNSGCVCPHGGWLPCMVQTLSHVAMFCM